MGKTPKVIGDAADTERMHFMQAEIVKAILPYRENTEAAIVVMALIRTARMLARLYPPATGDDLLNACCAYLKGQGIDEEKFRSKHALEALGLWVPPGSGSH